MYYFNNLFLYIINIFDIIDRFIIQQQEQDPTNLYITNLPPYFKETDLEKMLSKYGQVVSTKILFDIQMNSRGTLYNVYFIN